MPTRSDRPRRSARPRGGRAGCRSRARRGPRASPRSAPAGARSAGRRRSSNRRSRPAGGCGRSTWLRGYRCKGRLTPLSTGNIAVVAQGHSLDDYLETIYFLAFPIGEYTPRGSGSPPLASRVAEMLHVSRASAGEMLKRLEAEGLIERGARKEALMTERGRERAERVVRKHRLIERLLTDFMGYTGAEAHEQADQLGDTFTDEMIDRIDERLGHPQRCPHGWPVDPDVEQAENQHLAPLSELDAGAKATIVRLAEHDGELLHWFYDEGLVPGRELEVREAQPAAGQMTDKLNGTERAIGDKAAAGLFVRPA